MLMFPPFGDLFIITGGQAWWLVQQEGGHVAQAALHSPVYVSSISTGWDEPEQCAAAAAAAAAGDVMGKDAGGAVVAVTGLFLLSRTDTFFTNMSIILIIPTFLRYLSFGWLQCHLRHWYCKSIESPLFGFLGVLMDAPFFLLLAVLGFGGLFSVCIIQSKWKQSRHNADG